MVHVLVFLFPTDGGIIRLLKFSSSALATALCYVGLEGR